MMGKNRPRFAAMEASPSTTHARHRLRGYLPRFSRRDIVEGALIAVAFLLYFWVRGAVVDKPESAYWHARDVIDAQRALGIFWEPSWNDWAAAHHAIAQALNLVYFYLHFPLIIAFGMWVYYYRRSRYTFVRDSFLASGAIALVIYWLYPVAPPRDLPGLAAQYDPGAPAYIHGFIDTMKEYLGYAYDSQSTHAFVNPYAAMPSLHFGWDLLLGIAIIGCFRGTRLAWIAVPVGVFLPVSQIFAITMTANHFLLDAAAGGVVAMAGLGVSAALQRWGYPWLSDRARRLPRRGKAAEPAST
ncbi:MAG TPA: phosphatase PAP2 family protein [Dehalococcoidia bacterium]|nr:phosphatase PAP2 family protein [Dehalococcoidia bacterium]